MTSGFVRDADTRNWSLAAIGALAVHMVVVAVALTWTRPQEVPIPEPVVLVELPPPDPANAAEPAAGHQIAPEPLAQQAVQPIAPQLSLPAIRAPLPSSPVPVSNPLPAPAKSTALVAPADAAAPVATPTMATGGGNGSDPRALKQEADYFALVSAHLNRRKVYPAEARQARQQGVVTVRFTVARNGGVSAISIKRGSGHDILDRATLDLLQRVAPLPRMPASMARDSISLSLPIDYSLRTH